MEEQTTTGGAEAAAGATQAQPAEQQQTAAVTTDEQQTTQQTTDGHANADNPDDVTAFLTAKGIDPTDPEALTKVAGMARNAEKLMHTKTQEASEIKKSLEGQPTAKVSNNELEQALYEEVVNLKRTTAINDFKQRNSLTAGQEGQMAQYIADHPEKGRLVNAGALTLDDLYTLSGVNRLDPAQLKGEGKKEALQTLANKQRTTAPVGHQVTQGGKVVDDPFLAGFNSKD